MLDCPAKANKSTASCAEATLKVEMRNSNRNNLLLLDNNMVIVLIILVVATDCFMDFSSLRELLEKRDKNVITTRAVCVVCVCSYKQKACIYCYHNFILSLFQKNGVWMGLYLLYDK